MDLFSLHLNKLQQNGMIEPYNNQSFIRRNHQLTLPKTDNLPQATKEEEEKKTPVKFLNPIKPEDSPPPQEKEEEEEDRKQGIVNGTFTDVIEDEEEEEVENTYNIPNFMEEFTRNCPRAIMVVENDGTKTFYKSKLDYHQKTKKRIVKSFLKIGESTKIDKDTIAVAVTRRYMKENS